LAGLFTRFFIDSTIAFAARCAARCMSAGGSFTLPGPLHAGEAILAVAHA
jgi:hypothetical protein